MEVDDDDDEVKHSRNKEQAFILKRKRCSRLEDVSDGSDNGGGGGGGGGVDRRVSSICDYSSELRKSTVAENDEELANCLILLAQRPRLLRRQKSSQSSVISNSGVDGSGITDDDLYRCKTCDRTFGSFQALGGHRTSHRKPRRNLTDTLQVYDVVGCTSMTLEIPNCEKSISPNNKANKVHDCSICGAEFTSGQALGGHMRRHRPITYVRPVINDRRDSQAVKKTRSSTLELDLNLPAPEDDELESKVKLETKEQGLVFSASYSLVDDCNY